jgi:hypothetical protein
LRRLSRRRWDGVCDFPDEKFIGWLGGTADGKGEEGEKVLDSRWMFEATSSTKEWKEAEQLVT